MTKIKFLADEGGICGFEISGHSSTGCDDLTGKTVCAAVSSAAYMAANTVTEIIGDTAQAQVGEANMRFAVKNPSHAARCVLDGLKLHLSELAGQYGNRIVLYGGAENVKD